MVALNLFLEKVISINYKPDHNDIFLVQKHGLKQCNH